MPALPEVPVPAHYSADIAYRALRPLRPMLVSIRERLEAGGVAALQGKQMLAGVERIIEGIRQAHESGELDGDAVWSARAADTLAAMGAFLGVVRPIMVTYADQAGQLVAERAQAVAGGADLPLLNSDEALAEIPLSQADVDAVLAALADLGV